MSGGWEAAGRRETRRAAGRRGGGGRRHDTAPPGGRNPSPAPLVGTPASTRARASVPPQASRGGPRVPAAGAPRRGATACVHASQRGETQAQGQSRRGGSAHEIHADRRDVALGIRVVGEAQQQARFADARVADEHQLKDVVVLLGTKEDWVSTSARATMRAPRGAAARGRVGWGPEPSSGSGRAGAEAARAEGGAHLGHELACAASGQLSMRKQPAAAHGRCEPRPGRACGGGERRGREGSLRRESRDKARGPGRAVRAGGCCS